MAGHWETLMARDGHEFAAWMAAPAGAPRGAMLVLQEIFGVNAHIRSVVERYAEAGYLAIAPALFDRVQRQVELGYSPEDQQRGTGLRIQVPLDKALLDIGAALRVVRHAGKVGVVGYCWGGMLTWVCASALEVQAAVGYYTSRVWEQIERAPACPVLLHYGRSDAGIPLAEVEKLQARYPAAEVHLYDAGHGFACDARASYDAASAALAWERTQAFLRAHIG